MISVHINYLKLYRNDDIKPVVVPLFEEFSMQEIWPQVADDEELLKYLPDYKNRKLPNQDYFYTASSLSLASFHHV